MELFEKNKKLAFYALKKFDQKEGMLERDDLEQIALIGLWKACLKFDESKGNKFATYAVPTIQGEVMKEIRDRNSYFKVSRHAKIASKKIMRDYLEFGIPTPTVEEVMDKYGFSKLIARTTLELMDLKVESMSRPVSTKFGEVKLEDTIPDINANFYELIIENDELTKALETLDEREKTVVRYVANEFTQSEIGRMLGISQVHVSRIYKKALEKIRNYYEVNANENELQLA
jgi:RNA polymerase sporulation-specific sigma factor